MNILLSDLIPNEVSHTSNLTDNEVDLIGKRISTAHRRLERHNEIHAFTLSRCETCSGEGKIPTPKNSAMGARSREKHRRRNTQLP